MSATLPQVNLANGSSCRMGSHRCKIKIRVFINDTKWGLSATLPRVNLTKGSSSGMGSHRCILPLLSDFLTNNKLKCDLRFKCQSIHTSLFSMKKSDCWIVFLWQYLTIM